MYSVTMTNTYQLPAPSVIASLTPSQKAAVASDYVVYITLPNNEKTRAAYRSDPAVKREYRVQAWNGERGRPNLNGGSAVHQAAAAVGVSEAAIKQALVVRRRDPLLFVDVFEGRVSLTKAYAQLKRKRWPTPFTKEEIAATLLFLKDEIEARGWQNGNARRCPSARWLRNERRAGPHRQDPILDKRPRKTARRKKKRVEPRTRATPLLRVDLFKQLYNQMMDAYDAGKLDAAIDTARDLL